jgi:hypothetical protein
MRKEITQISTISLLLGTTATITPASASDHTNEPTVLGQRSFTQSCTFKCRFQ